MARRKKRSGRKSNMLSGLIRPAIGGLGYAVVGKPVIDMVASKLNLGIQDEYLQIIGAVVAKNFVKNKYVSSMADAAIYINAYKVSQNLTGNLNLFGSNPSTANTTTTATQSGDAWRA